MKKIILLLLFSFFISISCVSRKGAKEYIQFSHKNIMVVKGDKLIITLIPTQNKRKSVIVNTLRNNEQYNNRRIAFGEYKKIRELILETYQKDLELPQSPNKIVSIIDGGSNSILLKDNILEKKLYTHGVSKEYHGKFYEATELILKAAKLEMKDIN